jgi:hypothetical protein
MKERSLPSSPPAGAKRTALPTSQLVGRRCCAAPIEKLPYLPMLPSKNPPEQNEPSRHQVFFIPPPNGVSWQKHKTTKRTQFK